MNYIGSKFTLLPAIERVLDSNGVPASGVALDLFAGTGVVAQFLKKRGHIAYANDWQWYSYLTCVAYLEHNELPHFDTLLGDPYWREQVSAARIVHAELPIQSIAPAGPAAYSSTAARVLSLLSALPGEPGSFYDEYCEGGAKGRLYFSRDNGLRIQAIRDQIEAWSVDKLISTSERAWLIASLLEGADRVANTASVYGAYLKRVKQTARNPLRMFMPIPVHSHHPASSHQAYHMDSERLLDELRGERLTLVYIDPPYNARQYNSNYHILETISRWDLSRFQPRGVTGLRTRAENKSRYCLKTQVMEGFRSILTAVNADYVLFSYSSEGLVSREELETLFTDYCASVQFVEIPYKRFRADLDSDNRAYKADSTVEYLILGQMKQPGDTQIARISRDTMHNTPSRRTRTALMEQ